MAWDDGERLRRVGPEFDLDRNPRRQLLPLLPRTRQARHGAHEDRPVVAALLQRRMGRPDSNRFLPRTVDQPDGLGRFVDTEATSSAGQCEKARQGTAGPSAF